MSQPVRDTEESFHRPLEVFVDGDNLQKAMRKLQRKVSAEGVFRDLKRSRASSKPSIRRREKQMRAERDRRKRARRAARGAAR